MTAGFNKNAKIYLHSMFRMYIIIVMHHPILKVTELKLKCERFQNMCWLENNQFGKNQHFLKNFYFGLSKLGWTDRL